MADQLPSEIKLRTRDVFDMIVIRGIESVTRGLRHGEPFDLENLRPLAWRCRALADAFDARVKNIEGEQTTETDKDLQK